MMIDLSTAASARKVNMIERCLLAGGAPRRRRRGFPHWVVLDEIHCSLRREGVAERASATEDKGSCFVTYTSSRVRPSVTSGTTFTATPRATPHVRHLGKYADATVRPEQAILFRAPDGRLVATADSLTGFRRTVATTAEDALAYHTGRHDFYRSIRGVFSDAELAAGFRKAGRRWSRGEVADLHRLIDELIGVRYWSEEL